MARPFTLLLSQMPPERISLAVPRQLVNEFLQRAWETFAEEIGHVACMHSYHKSKRDNQVYLYKVLWQHEPNGFFAEIVFFNHTHKGLIAADTSVLDLKTLCEHSDIKSRIKKALIFSQNSVVNRTSPEKLFGCKGIISTDYQLSGFYDLGDHILSPVVMQDTKDVLSNSHVYFLSTGVTEADAFYKAIDHIQSLAPALTLLTHSLFKADSGSLQLFQVNDKNEWWEKVSEQVQMLECGQYIDDHGMTKRRTSLNEQGAIDLRKVLENNILGEILESENCLIEDKLALPKRVKEVLQTILNDKALINSAKRFQEGIYLDRQRTISSEGTEAGDKIYPYTLIAFVASIESVLDTQVKKVPRSCSNCGESVYVEERQIAKAFKDFVRVYSAEMDEVGEWFNQVYSDRSKFVHTGISPVDLNYKLPNGPLFLEGKTCRRNVPTYWGHLCNFTGLFLRKHMYARTFNSPTFETSIE